MAAGSETRDVRVLEARGMLGVGSREAVKDSCWREQLKVQVVQDARDTGGGTRSEATKDGDATAAGGGVGWVVDGVGRD